MDESESERVLKDEDWDDLPDADARDELPDPWHGDHSIEYWVWDGSRLVPATPQEIARIKEDERIRAMFRRLYREERGLKRRLSALAVTCAASVRQTAQQLWRYRQHQRRDQAARGEGAHEKHPSQ